MQRLLRYCIKMCHSNSALHTTSILFTHSNQTQFHLRAPQTLFWLDQLIALTDIPTQTNASNMHNSFNRKENRCQCSKCSAYPPLVGWSTGFYVIVAILNRMRFLPIETTSESYSVWQIQFDSIQHHAPISTSMIACAQPLFFLCHRSTACRSGQKTQNEQQESDDGDMMGVSAEAVSTVGGDYFHRL